MVLKYKMKRGKKANGVLPRKWSQQTLSSNNTRDYSTHGHHQIVNIEIILIIFFAAKDGDAPYRKQNKTRS